MQPVAYLRVKQFVNQAQHVRVHPRDNHYIVGSDRGKRGKLCENKSLRTGLHGSIGAKSQRVVGTQLDGSIEDLSGSRQIEQLNVGGQEKHDVLLTVTRGCSS